MQDESGHFFRTFVETCDSLASVIFGTRNFKQENQFVSRDIKMLLDTNKPLLHSAWNFLVNQHTLMVILKTYHWQIHWCKVVHKPLKGLKLNWFQLFNVYWDACLWRCRAQSRMHTGKFSMANLICSCRWENFVNLFCYKCLWLLNWHVSFICHRKFVMWICSCK